MSSLKRIPDLSCIIWIHSLPSPISSLLSWFVPSSHDTATYAQPRPEWPTRQWPLVLLLPFICRSTAYQSHSQYMFSLKLHLTSHETLHSILVLEDFTESTNHNQGLNHWKRNTFWVLINSEVFTAALVYAKYCVRCWICSDEQKHFLP